MKIKFHKSHLSILFFVSICIKNILSASGLSPVSYTNLNGPGNGTDIGFGVATDAAGDVFVVGTLVGLSAENIWIGKLSPSLRLKNQTIVNSDIANSVNSARDIFIDNNRNIYVVGINEETVGGANIWLGKFNSSLTLLNSTTFNGPNGGTDSGMAITSDGTFFYITGAISTSSGSKGWIGKYNSSLVLISSFTINDVGATSSNFADIAVDNSGSVYALGGIQFGGGISFDRIAKYDSNLALVSSITLSGASLTLNSLTTDLSNNIYAVGYDNVSGVNVVSLSKFDNALVFQSSVIYNAGGHTGIFFGESIALNPIDNHLYVVGRLNDSTVGSGLLAHAIEFNTSLVLISTATINGPTSAPFDTDVARGVIADSNGNVYMTGSINQTDVSGNTDILVARFGDPVVFPSSVDASRAYPNPFLPQQGHTEITFDNLPVDASIKIFTVERNNWV
jgi:hypothetical protein